MKTIWKDVIGYSGIYQVSNTGLVKRLLKRGRNGEKEHLIKPHITKGYVYVTLVNRPYQKDKQYLLHRLVAETFIPNPNNYPEVNHKDENKQNNNVNNLEWCTHSYNMAYKNARLRQGISCSNPVEQRTIDGILIATYVSVPIAARINNVDVSCIIKCCNHKQKSASGYIWEYVHDNQSPSCGAQ